MLRIHQIDALDGPELTAILQACQVLDPRAGDLVNGVYQDLFPADPASALDKLFTKRIAPAPPADEAAARQRLLAIVKRETTRLAKKVKRHEVRAELEASLSKDRLAFDASTQGEMLRGYELYCNEFLFRILDDLTKRQPGKRIRFEPVSQGARAFAPNCSSRWMASPRVNSRVRSSGRRSEFCRTKRCQQYLPGLRTVGHIENLGTSLPREDRMTKRIKVAKSTHGNIDPVGAEPGNRISQGGPGIT